MNVIIPNELIREAIREAVEVEVQAMRKSGELSRIAGLEAVNSLGEKAVLSALGGLIGKHVTSRVRIGVDTDEGREAAIGNIQAAREKIIGKHGLGMPGQLGADDREFIVARLGAAIALLDPSNSVNDQVPRRDMSGLKKKE